MPRHPQLPPPATVPERRTPTGFPPPPPRNPRRHGQHLTQDLTTAQAVRRIPTGVDPNLVFKILTPSGGLDEESLARRGLVTLGDNGAHTYFVLTSDDGAALRAALDQYSSGDDREGAKGTYGTIFNKVDSLALYGPEDRRGVGLDDVATDGTTFVVDISVWPSEDYTEARRRADVIQSVVTRSGGSMVHAAQVSARVTVIRVSINAGGLEDLLATSVVEKVRTPPVPYMDPSDWQDISLVDIEIHPVEGTPVGVLDDVPATGHPLLGSLVASVDEFGPSGHVWQQQGHHGTLVTGRVLYPRLQESLRDHTPFEAVGHVHIARVLEPDPVQPLRTRFAGGDLGEPPHLVVRRAVEYLADTYDVRVFNISIGYDEPYDGSHVGEFTETLDELVRERNIVIVVPAGNVPVSLTGTTVSGHHGGHDYPGHLDAPEHRIAEPGPAALAVCVGSVAHSDAPREWNPPRIGNKAVAPTGGVSPFSRSGPGVGHIKNYSNKPDFVHEGGNWVVTDTGNLILEDHGVSVISTALEPSGRLFRATSGTSFAVPMVARAAADVLHEYPDASANLVRALLGASATDAGLEAAKVADVTARRRLYGLGKPTADTARLSDERRVTMTFDGEMAVDSVVVHPIPVPEAFATTLSRTRRVRIAMAYDPPVRRQRREYLASTMQVDLFRAMTLDEVQDLVGKQDPANGVRMISDRRRVALEPGSDHVRSATLHVRAWEPKRLNVDDGETYYLVVTNTTKPWARDRTDYGTQNYALSVVLEDEGRLDLDLFSLVTQQVQPGVRARLRT